MHANNQSFDEWLKIIRRDFHIHPELAFQEYRTTDRILGLLEKMGLEAQRFKDHTGAVGLLRGAYEGPTIALRADIDALPVTELGSTPYQSQNEGCMHACGHDANMAIMLGVARRLSDSGAMQQCHGNVKFIFQPAEEQLSGAATLIDAGVLESPTVDCIIAGHMAPNLQVGQIGVFKNIGYASADSFDISVVGKGTHGARPEQGTDPIVAAAAMVTMLQSIVSRNVKPSAAGVISVGMIHGGTAGNVIPESVNMAGTIRALDPVVRKLLEKRLKEVVTGIANTYGVQCQLELHDGTPLLVTDERISAFIFKTAQKVAGMENVSYVPPTMGSEDFAFFTRRCPGTIIRLGCANLSAGLNAPLHSPYFDIDERVLGLGVEVFTQAVTDYLHRATQPGQLAGPDNP